jgi:Ser/Thr protein kinase RdoA (MazF antagonist)
MHEERAAPTPAIARRAARAFSLDGEPLRAERLGSGHIPDPFAIEVETRLGARRYVLQRVHSGIFVDPEALMGNLVRVTAHLAAKLAQAEVPDRTRRALALVPERGGRAFHRDAEGAVWRCFDLIEGSVAIDSAPAPAQAFEAARAFGAFVAALADLAGPPLAEVIPHFHDLPRRLGALEAALLEASPGRARAIGREADDARAVAERLAIRLAAVGAEEVPRRTVHNDCKVNNVLLDARSGEGLCVIDLDTVMPGNVLADFGDLVRTATSTAPEDERELERIEFDRVRFEALARGYLAGAGPILQRSEQRALPLAGPLLALENAVRFLTDYLQGDRYFRIHRPEHNLDRARAQLRLTRRMLDAAPDADAIVRRLAREGGLRVPRGG